MHRRIRLALLAVTASSAIVVPAAPAAAAPPPGVPEPRPRVNAAPPGEITNVAHRGASAYAPENTLAAVRLARTQRADMFEIDVQQTKDNKLVLMHDTTLARTTNVEEVYPNRAPWRVSDFTLAEIKRLDAGSWFATRYRDERVPTLDEVLKAMDGQGLGMLLEVKSPSLYPGIEKRIAAALKRAPSWLRPDPKKRRLVVQSLEVGVIAPEVRASGPSGASRKGRRGFGDPGAAQIMTIGIECPHGRHELRASPGTGPRA